MTTYSNLQASLCGRCGTRVDMHHLGEHDAGCPWWVPPAPCGYQGCTQQADHANIYGLCTAHHERARAILVHYSPKQAHMGGRW